MKIVLPTNQDGSLCEHFGQSRLYQVYEIINNEIIKENSLVYALSTCGCKSNIGKELVNSGVEIAIVGGIGEGALDNLTSAGLQVIRGCSGACEDLALAYIAGTLKDNGKTCNHHNHEHIGGRCGDHHNHDINSHSCNH